MGGREIVSSVRSRPSYFATYTAAEAGCETLVKALVSRLELPVNGSVLAALDPTGMARVSYSEKDRSASDLFWRGIVDPLEEFLASVPGLARRDFASSLGDDGGRYMFQVQWLTGRKANYWHQDVRWKTHWDVVLFLYLGEIPTPTDLACPEEPPASDDPRDYVRHPDGQPEIAERTKSGALTTYRPTIARGDVILIDNRKVWHRTAPTLETTTTSWSVDALMTIRLKHFLA